MYGLQHEITHTASRWAAPRKWLKAITWLIGAGIHPKANQTTLKAAEDIAARMDYSTGHARYCEAEMVARTGISRANLYRHMSYLRELGGLAYVQHGTRKNVLAAMGLKGYAGTATVYAAVIPAVYDHAMGHTIVGSGYGARIVIDQPAQEHPDSPVDTSGNTPVDNETCEALETPSRSWVKEEDQVQMGGGFNYTSQQTASRDRAAIPGQRLKKHSGSSRHALQVAQDIRIAAQVRPLVNWTQREGLRRLAYALRPLIDAGMDAYGIAAYLNDLCTGLRWRPKAPASYISTVLAARTQADQQRADTIARYELENPTPGAFQASPAAQRSFMDALDEGIALYRQKMRARGHDDLCTPYLAPTTAAVEHTDAEAAADFAAFLGTNTVLTPAF